MPADLQEALRRKIAKKQEQIAQLERLWKQDFARREHRRHHLIARAVLAGIEADGDFRQLVVAVLKERVTAEADRALLKDILEA